MAYAYYRTCTVDHTQCGASDSSAFPVLVQFTDPTMKLVANGGHINNTVTSNGQTVCADLAFFSDAGLTTPLNWEVEFYDGVNGILIAWVQLPTLSHSSNVVFYMAYDDASVTTFQGNVNGTWDGNYLSVWHLPNGTLLAAADSTSNANTGTASGVTVLAATGQIDGGAELRGNNVGAAPLITGANIINTSQATMSCWLMIIDQLDQYLGIVQGGSLFDKYFTGVVVSGSTYAPSFSWYDGATRTINPTTGFAINTWFHAVGTIDGGGLGTLYINGASQGTQTSSGSFVGFTGPGLTAGKSISTDFSIDEIRVSSIARSADWITAEYNNQKSSSTFLTVGSETAIGGGTVVKSSGVRGWSWKI